MKLLTASLFCLAALAPLRPPPQGISAEPIAQPLAPCPNPWPHEPLVVYEVTGGTLVGPVDSLLVVYADGLARYSSSLGPGPGFALTAYVSPSVASQLHATLIGAGALRQCDLPSLTNDVPLSTLTVLRGASLALGNSFSWFLPEDGVVTMEGALATFIAATFPGAPGGGSSF